LIEGFLLSCKVENKSPATASFYKNILDKFQCFAISFLRNGANPFELQIALGHSTLEMTRRYTQALGFDDVFKRHMLASPVDRLIR